MKPGLGNNLKGWVGEGGGKGVQVGGDIGKPMADSCWCLVETTQYCKAIIVRLEINFKKLKKIKVVFYVVFMYYLCEKYYKPIGG